eukprot:6182318-Pyramimonas_sp.AAC.1
MGAPPEVAVSPRAGRPRSRCPTAAGSGSPRRRRRQQWHYSSSTSRQRPLRKLASSQRSPALQAS